MSKTYVLIDEHGYLHDKDGEFGFIQCENGKVTFKLTEEKYLTVEEMEEILSHMKEYKIDK